MVVASHRAKKKKILFTIGPLDIKIPNTCPLLGIDLIKNSNKTCANSPTIDRIDSSKGYTLDNIWIVSHKANAAKSNLSLNELKLLVKNLEQKLLEQKINERM